MSKGIVSTIMGGVEVAAGAVLLATGVGAPFGAALILAGAGSVLTGIAEMLEKQPGQGTATMNPVGPYNYVYGTMKVPGVCIFSETNSVTQTGATTSADKQWHRVMALACHPTEALLEVRLDGQVVNLVQQSSSVANTTIWQSASPTQTTLNISSISRSGGIVTMVFDGDMPATFDGQTLLVSQVADNTYNGVWTCWLPNPSDLTTWQFIAGGADGSSSGGTCATCLPDYSNKIHVEFQNGNQKNTFPGLLEAQVGSTAPLTWTATDVCYGHSLVYIQFGYDAAYFPSYPTNLSFVVQGKSDILDPRTGDTGYTENAALCIADYMAQPRLRGGFGLAIGTTIDPDNLIAAANICDETIQLAAGGTAPQYTCDTVISLDTPRGTTIQQMLSSCAGRLSVQGGTWSILPGAFVAPSLTLDEGNIVGPIQMDTRLSIVEACNAVKGTFVSEGNNYQPSDYALYQQDQLHGFETNEWLAEDGDEILVHNLDLPCTSVSACAQRLAKIQLMRSRFQYRLHLQCDLTAYQAAVGDVISISIARYNFVAEPFEVLHVGLTYDDNGKPTVELDLAQVDGASSAANSQIYSWSPTEELTITDSLVPNNVGTRICVPPNNVVAYSGPATTINGIALPSTIITSADGSQTSGIYVTWEAPNDANVVNGGHIEVQWQPVGAATFTSLGKVDPSTNYAWITNVSYLGQYVVQVRAVNAADVPSVFVDALPDPITVITETPQQVINVEVSEDPAKYADGTMADLISVAWDIAEGDTVTAGVQIFVSNYSGNPNPVQIAEGNVSPVSFLLNQTGEACTITVVAVSAAGVAAPFAGAPSAVVVLNGVATAPPFPSFASAQTALPNNSGWTFQLNVIGGAVAASATIAGYRIYNSTTPTPPVAGTNWYRFEAQPPTNSGTITVQMVTPLLMFFWASTVDVYGNESPLNPAPFTFVNQGAPAPTAPTPVTTTTTIRPTTLLNGWAAEAHRGDFDQNGTAVDSSSAVQPYANPGNAYDGNMSTAAVASGTHDTAFFGCVWGFSNFAGLPSGATVTGLTLSVTSSTQPTSGPTHGSSDVFYSIDGGISWVNVYFFNAPEGDTQTLTRPTTSDTVTTIPLTQVITDLQVMAFVASTNDIQQSVYEISLAITYQASAAPDQVVGVTATTTGANNNIQISWPSLLPLTRTDVLNFQVTRSVGGQGYTHSTIQTTIAWDGASSYSWVDEEAVAGDPFEYYVIANSSGGASAPSAVAQLSGAASAFYTSASGVIASVDSLRPAQPNADKTSLNVSVGIAGQGALATQSEVALATQVSGQLPLANHAASVIQGSTGLNRNLVPDSDIKFGQTYWNFGSGGGRFSIGQGSPFGISIANPGNNFILANFPAGTFAFISSAPFSLIAGQTYTLSAYLDNEGITAGSSQVDIFDPTLTTRYAALTQEPQGSSRVSTTFVFQPGGVGAGTAVKVVLIYDTSAATTIPTFGDVGYMGSPMVQMGSVATAYQPSLMDDATGYLVAGTAAINFGSSIHTGTLPYDNAPVAVLTALGPSGAVNNLGGVAAAGITPIAGLMPTEQGANVTAHHVLTAVATATNGSTASSTTAWTAIPGLAFSATTTGPSDVYNFYLSISLQGSTVNNSLTACIGYGPNTPNGSNNSNLIQISVGENPTVIPPISAVFSLTGLPAGTNTLTFYVIMTSGGGITVVDDEFGSSTLMCQRIF